VYPFWLAEHPREEPEAASNDEELNLEVPHHRGKVVVDLCFEVTREKNQNEMTKLKHDNVRGGGGGGQ